MNQTVLITGGTGLVGNRLSSMLLAAGYDIIILTRSQKVSQNSRVTYALWDIDAQTIDGTAVGRADFIVHLAGAGVMEKKWTDEYKKEIVESRTRSSALILKGLTIYPNKVKAVVAASAIGWYGKDDAPLKHSSGFIETDPPAKDFLGETCRAWEESIEPLNAINIRLARFRIGIVFSKEGGAFPEFTKSLKFGIASILGNGKQMISWIHIDDLCRLFIHAIIDQTIHGTYNAVAPSPITNKTLILNIAKHLRKTFFIPVHVPSFVLKVMLGERSIEILKSATVDDAKIRNQGFTFEYPSVDAALNQLYPGK